MSSPYDAPPDLDNRDLFECRPGVPILDVHSRHGWEVDEDRLKLVCDNSNERAARNELGLILIGHTTEDGPETAQPPLAGFTRNYQMGQWRGKPCILADMFFRNEKRDEAFEYPRRSVEVYYSDKDPASNYIDAVSLMKRSPERDLGFVTYSKARAKERYGLDLGDSPPVLPATAPAVPSLPESGPEPVPTPPLVPPQEPPSMDPQTLAAIATLTTLLQTMVASAAAPVVAPAPVVVAPPEAPASSEEAPAAPVPDPEDASESEPERMSRDQMAIKVERYSRQVTETKAEVDRLKTENAELQRYNRREKREKTFIQLEAEGYDLDRADEVDETQDLSEAAFTAHVAKIRKRYSKSPVGQGHLPDVDANPNTPAAKKVDDELTKADFAKLDRYCKDHKIDKVDDAVLARYKADRKAGTLAV